MSPACTGEASGIRACAAPGTGAGDFPRSLRNYPQNLWVKLWMARVQAMRGKGPDGVLKI
ncbi:hypothetical protein GCM10011326_34030 [Salipiger profundus]|nr:hypothetical protein GCM10011326_34030 [Salipiger profundus]